MIINESVCVIIICVLLMCAGVYWKITRNTVERMTNPEQLVYTLSIAPYSLKEGVAGIDTGNLLYTGEENNRLTKPFNLVLAPTAESELVGDLIITDQEIDYNGEKATMRYVKSRKGFITIELEDEKKPRITFDRSSGEGSVVTINYKESPIGEISEIVGGYQLNLTNHQTIKDIVPYITGGVILWDTVTGK